MERLRAIARQQHRPVSELVRRAVDPLLEQIPTLPPKQAARFPTFHGGGRPKGGLSPRQKALFLHDELVDVDEAR